MVWQIRGESGSVSSASPINREPASPLLKMAIGLIRELGERDARLAIESAMVQEHRDPKAWGFDLSTLEWIPIHSGK